MIGILIIGGAFAVCLLVYALISREEPSRLTPESQDEQERLTRVASETVVEKRKPGRPRKTPVD